MQKRTRVQRLYEDLREWPKQDFNELLEKMLDLRLDRGEEIKHEANMVVAKGSSTELEKWAEKQGQLQGVTTGYWTLDRMTAGLCGGDLDIIAGVSSIGKTNLAVNMMARQMALGYKVAFVTLEMSKRSIIQRLYSIMTKKYFDGIMQTEPMLVQEQDRIPYESIKYAVKQAKEWGADVFYIDHLHYFSRTMENQAEGLGAITQEFKLVAKEYDIPIVLISQMRKTEGRRPTGEDLRGSALIRQDADVVLILDKNEEIMKQDGTTDNVRVTLDKNRDRLIWKIGSEVTLWKYGLDLREDNYNPYTDSANDVTGQARGDGNARVDFTE